MKRREVFGLDAVRRVPHWRVCWRALAGRGSGVTRGGGGGTAGRSVGSARGRVKKNEVGAQTRAGCSGNPRGREPRFPVRGKKNNTWDSNVVPHRSTNQAR